MKRRGTIEPEARRPAREQARTHTAEGCTPAWPVTTTKGAGATPQGPASGRDLPKTPPQELAERGSADSPGEPRKLQRENSTGAGKWAALHTEAVQRGSTAGSSLSERPQQRNPQVGIVRTNDSGAHSLPGCEVPGFQRQLCTVETQREELAPRQEKRNIAT
ncbi:hypothetical protein NDU88_006825 [Pleurodeles waltl]|uniref:Uncharacterized protein n=1 Tax=Pleurodeles waltl TaxID=8319 RepID=A0AAV7X2P7_PLEWA|nr:hypothetical protein NDU88_006825 [Pleurodeles waltl]